MTNDDKPTVAVVGTGRMGANMALRLKDVGHRIAAVYDARPESAEAVAAQTGGVHAKNLADVTRAADVIITVVSDDAAMHAIFAESGDSLLVGARGKIFVNSATVSPAVHIEVERRAEAHGASAIEASMASSITQAREGTLYLMIGGKRETFERVRPMLEAMSASLRYIGFAGKAGQLKALVNMVMNTNTAALAEGLGLADALQLDLSMVREVFAGTGAASRVLETDGLDMQNREHDVFFSASHAAKDSHIALALAQEVHLDLPVAAAAAAQFDRMTELGLGDLDKSGVAELTFKSRHAGDVHVSASR